MSDVSDDEGDNQMNQPFDEAELDFNDNVDESSTKKRKLDQDEEEELHDKRQKVVNEEEEVTFVPRSQVGDQEGDKDFYCKTLNIKDFCNVLAGCCSVTDINYIVMTFTPKGMGLYAKPDHSCTAAVAFFNSHMFEEYKVSKTVKRVLTKQRLDYLKKKINKEVEHLEIRALDSGFQFSGHRTYKTGGKCTFKVNILDVHSNIDVIDMSALNYQWHVTTSSQKFKDNVDFIDDSNEFIRMVVKSQCLEFSGVDDMGNLGESISQETETKISEPFESLFYKKYMKVVTITKDLNKSLTISFIMDQVENSYPILFQYALDQEPDQSHFSIYILPFTTTD